MPPSILTRPCSLPPDNLLHASHTSLALRLLIRLPIPRRPPLRLAPLPHATAHCLPGHRRALPRPSGLPGVRHVLGSRLRRHAALARRDGRLGSPAVRWRSRRRRRVARRRNAPVGPGGPPCRGRRARRGARRQPCAWRRDARRRAQRARRERRAQYVLISLGALSLPLQHTSPRIVH